MSKYVRTKDGYIFEVEKNLGKYGTSKAVLICDMQGNIIYVQEQNNILKQADTIEELCDEFVIVHNIPFTDPERFVNIWENGIPYNKSMTKLFDYCKQKVLIDIPNFLKDENNGFKDYLPANFIYKGTLHAAIWTDKGLIYVAKMNDKGELELI